MKNLGLNVLEGELLAMLAMAWNSYCELPDRSKNDNELFRDGINDCERIIALRVARRVNPLAWTQPCKKEEG